MNIEEQVLNNASTGNRDIYTNKQACDLLDVSARTLWRERRARRISFRRVGGSIRYTATDLAEYLERCKQSAIAA